MLGFLLLLRRWRLFNVILATLCAKVGTPSPQKLMGELAHSVTQELSGNSSHSLMCFVHSLSTTPDRNESVKLYILSLVWLLILREESFSRIFLSFTSNSFFGTEFKDLKSKILPRYLKWPPKETAGIIPLLLKFTLGKICWNFLSCMATPKDKHLSSLMSIFAQSHQASKRLTKH